MLICNGDTTDTRPQANKDEVLRRRAVIDQFIQQSSSRAKFLTGNHDPDISSHHHDDLSHGAILVTHGDILYGNIVPWGYDAELARELVARARRELPHEADKLLYLLHTHRRAASAIPQRHQATKHGLKYLIGLTDTIWPPKRILRILKAWKQFPHRGQALLQRHRPQARFLICGHTHRPGIWHRPDGRIIINTGSFCPPSGRLMVDVNETEILVRRIRRRRGDYHPGRIIAQFALTPPNPSNTPTSWV